MPSQISRRQALARISLGCAAPWSLAAMARAAQERKPPGSRYGLAYTHSMNELVGDLLDGPRGEAHRESETPHHEWYSHRIRQRYGGWGPRARRYDALVGLAERSIAWKRERVIATAARFIGYDYQHHHIPDWNPPADWPWKECCAGRNGKGVDCSNFTSFVYNQGFGIHMTSAVERQSRADTALKGTGHFVALKPIVLPEDFKKRQEVLETGDLVYIRGREDGPITHVVIWLGSVGRAPGDVPLVLDSHGSDVDDDEGQPIPCGIRLRPWREHSWYNRCASHAHRVF